MFQSRIVTSQLAFVTIARQIVSDEFLLWNNRLQFKLKVLVSGQIVLVITQNLLHLFKLFDFGESRLKALMKPFDGYFQPLPLFQHLSRQRQQSRFHAVKVLEEVGEILHSHLKVQIVERVVFFAGEVAGIVEFVTERPALGIQRALHSVLFDGRQNGRLLVVGKCRHDADVVFDVVAENGQDRFKNVALDRS